jgi:hypothetical protein
MKLIRLCLAIGLAVPMAASAQVSGVSVEVRLEQEHFLPDEDVRVAVRITNMSGQTLHLGDSDDWLTFSVEARENYVVRRLGLVPVRAEFSLESSRVATKRANVTPYFSFEQPGRYHLVATVRIPQWDEEITSPPVRFDVITGTRLREFKFGVPLPQDAPPQPPEIRRYILQQAQYLKQMKMYVRLTDASGTDTMRVFPIGPMVSFGEPQAQVDRLSRLHVLHQTGARTFNYCVVTPDGHLAVRQTHEYTATRPNLRSGPGGTIFVAGGARRFSPEDLPPAAVENALGPADSNGNR